MPDSRAFATVDAFEHRGDRHDDPSGILHPNGSQALSTDADFIIAATREVLALHEAERVRSGTADAAHAH